VIDRSSPAGRGEGEAPQLLLKNGKVLDYFPPELETEPAPRVEAVDLRLAGGRIAERGPELQPQAQETTVDLVGAVVLPGNINAHTHLYNALTAGMPLPENPPVSFTDILAELWWPLDRALDAEAIHLSAVAGAWDAVRCGTTLVFDHHSSLTCVENSLDLVERGLAEVGLRGCLCYEVTDRGGKGLRDIMLVENERYLQKLRDNPQPELPRFRGMVGAHASFTLEERTLELLAGICQRHDAPIHMHLAEGTTDREISQDRSWSDPLDRLMEFGLVRPGSVFVHGVDLSPLDMQTLEERQAWLVHCGRSNMAHGVGRAPVDRFPPRRALGTDGLDDNMWGELRTTYFRGNEGGRGPLGLRDAASFWLGNYRLAREMFGEPFGNLDRGSPADLIVLDQFQKTPLTTETWLSHLLYDFHPWDIESVYVGGKRVYRSGDRAPVAPQQLQEVAARLWNKMGWM
jgi:cytosine/adenosine deaminase-related metal-dependent hydrolase